MKRIFLLLALCLCLTGCASMAPSDYWSSTPHAGTGGQSDTADAVTVKNYLGLKNAILGFVREGQTEGTIRVTSYDGDVESDLAEAAYEVSKLDPLGAYAIDYMTHECTLIVSYYEIRVHITFRRTAAEIASIVPIATQLQLQNRLEEALDRYESRVTLRVSNYQEQDIPALVAEYCAANPGTIMETPQTAVSVYPDSGQVRILEINLLYTETPEALLEKQSAVGESLDAAAEYIRYRQGDRDKAALLFTYLTERFSYEAGETATPLYDALCGGLADPKGLAQAWQLICDRAGVECYTVSGMRDGEAYTWNIVSADGYYRHLDLARCILETERLSLETDEEMSGYYWNTAQYPACEPEPPQEPETPPEPVQPQTPAEETPPQAPEAPPEEPTEELPAQETP